MSNNPIHKFLSWLRDRQERFVVSLKRFLEYLRDKMFEDALEELREIIKSLNNDDNNMKLIAEITIGGDGTIIYAGSVTADKEPLNETTAMQVDVLTEAHHAMKEAVDKVNASLMERGLTEKLANPNRDESGNPRIPGYGIRIIN